MMGNEKSQPAGLSIDDTTTEVTDSWSLHGATYAIGSVPKVSVFLSNSAGGVEPTRLEKFAKNVKIYRHPCILKYVASWKKGSKFHLATEQVQPLAQVLPSQTTLQICVGLQNIVKALVFLHEFAAVSHNNVCRAAVYVSQGGSWKLGGLEYVCRFNELSSGYLEETRLSRYDLAISPNEADHLPHPPGAIDCYAFGVLVQEVLSNKNADDVPGMADFLDMCKKSLQNTSPEARPTLSSLLLHPFFSHEFLTVHNFLAELPIKKEDEKQDFFRNLVLKLNTFPEETVASQLGSQLLSRMVLLDPTAQHYVLPQVFVPRKDDKPAGSLFSENTFKTHMVPRLLPLFCVRDVHIRMILLSHFHSYCSLFSQVQLQSRILPELLVGIKDTNDNLVSCTLKALAELVPVLGGAVVIGGKRAKLFADGRPKAVKFTAKPKRVSKTDSSMFSEIEGKDGQLVLPERPSPDGGEYVPSEEDEAWPEWDDKGVADTSEGIAEISETSEIKTYPLDPIKNELAESTKNIVQTSVESFDLKFKQKEEFEDIFRDMEPVISKPQVLHVVEAPTTVSNKFALTSDLPVENDGWSDDCDAWNDLDDVTSINDTMVES